MKRKSLIILLLVSLTFVFCKEEGKSNKKVPQPESFSIINTYMSALTELKQFNGVLLVEDSAGHVFSKAYNIETEIPTLKVSVLHQFDLRSIAKLFAKASLVKLEHEEKIAFDQKLSDFFPEFPRGDEITIDQLMHHQSGLGRELSNFDENTAELSPEEVISLIHQEELEFEPGTDTRYSNLGFQLLYKIIGDAAGGTYADYLRNNFFAPLGMTNSGSHYLNPKGQLNNNAFGHTEKNDSIQIVGEDESDMQQGHTYSTVEDMKKFLDFITENKIYHELAEDSIITHAGGSKGKRAWVYANLSKGYKIVFLANYDNIPFSNLTKDLIAIMEGNEVEIPKEVNRKAVEISESILKKYAGTYDFVDAGHIMISIKFENGQLKAYQKGEFAGDLIPENDSTFFWDAKSKESFIFTNDEEGNQKALMDFQGVRWDGVLIE
ncbi:Beta-lactamase [Marivirga sericea]|uniref:Beta-lactamase n=1 Tax=Marivirga sericea TaxID=1028 RepID=A0A1X7KC17_9BACT|nr:serine hydrolase domain-containing protein [Marivirga sericea]SMG38743.1 Beta-lactamase [Marivirga sericea]